MICQINLIINKLLFFKENLLCENVTHLPSLRITDEYIRFCNEEMNLFANNVQYVHEKMETQFSKFADLSSSIKLLCNPFDIAVSDCNQKEIEARAKFQMELL